MAFYRPLNDAERSLVIHAEAGTVCRLVNDEVIEADLIRALCLGPREDENTARALLIPRRRPGQRTPLWQQRLKAQGLLQVARRYPDFPIVLETVRECLARDARSLSTWLLR